MVNTTGGSRRMHVNTQIQLSLVCKTSRFRTLTKAWFTKPEPLFTTLMSADDAPRSFHERSNRVSSLRRGHKVGKGDLAERHSTKVTRPQQQPRKRTRSTQSIVILFRTDENCQLHDQHALSFLWLSTISNCKFIYRLIKVQCCVQLRTRHFSHWFLLYVHVCTICDVCTIFLTLKNFDSKFMSTHYGTMLRSIFYLQFLFFF